MAASQQPDPFVAMERLSRRRILAVFAPILLVIVAFWMILLWPPTADQVVRLLVITGILYAILAGFGLALSYFGAGALNRLAPLLPHVRESAWPIGRGPAFLLDNGLLLSIQRDTLSVSLFLGPDDSVLHPTLGNALRWTGLLNSGRTAIVRSGRGASAAQAELKMLQMEFGANFSLARVKELKTRETGWPRWIVSVSAFRCFRGPGIDKFAREPDTVKSHLQNLQRQGTSSVVG